MITAHVRMIYYIQIHSFLRWWCCLCCGLQLTGRILEVHPHGCTRHQNMNTQSASRLFEIIRDYRNAEIISQSLCKL